VEEAGRDLRARYLTAERSLNRDGLLETYFLPTASIARERFLQQTGKFNNTRRQSMNDKRRAEEIAAARREIARRIARFCTTLSEEQLNTLLDRMAYVQWKYDVAPIVVDVPPLKHKSRELPG
jgi:GAF domain-containing protein